MPTSNLALARDVVHLVHEAAPKSVLDVGPGFGKYGLLLREYVNEHLIIDAVEAWRPYVERFEWLKPIYDGVIQADVLDLADITLASYDLVLMVDVIEHLDKEAGLALLERIPGRVVICTPLEWLQNPEAEERPPERHRSLWDPKDFEERAEVLYTNLGGILTRLAPLS